MIMDTIKPKVMAAIQATVGDDKNISVSLTYKRYLGNVYDETKGETVASYEEHQNVAALKLAHNKQSVLRANTRVEIGQTVFMLESEQLPGKPETNDLLIEGGTTYQIKDTQVIGFMYAITVDA